MESESENRKQVKHEMIFDPPKGSHPVFPANKSLVAGYREEYGQLGSVHCKSSDHSREFSAQVSRRLIDVGVSSSASRYPLPTTHSNRVLTVACIESRANNGNR